MTASFFRRISFLLTFVFISLHCCAQNTKTTLLKGIDHIPMPPAGEYLSFFYPTNDQPEIIAMAKWEVDYDIRSTAIITSTLGKGKIIALGSSAYFKPTLLQNEGAAKFVSNILSWSAPGRKSVVAALSNNIYNNALRGLLDEHHVSAYITDDFKLKKHTDVLIMNSDVTDPASLKRIETFVANGGTLIFASPYANYFTEHNKTAELKVNQLLLKAGICSVDQLAKPSKTNNKLLTDSVPDYLQVTTMLPRLLQDHETDRDNFINYYFITPILDLAIQYNDINSPVIKKLKSYFKIPDPLPVPLPGKPVINNTAGLKAALRIGYRLYLKEQDFEHHPTAKAAGFETFPGAVPDTAARTDQAVTIPVMVGRQGLPDMPSIYFRPHSTGLYVPAGEKVTVTISKNDIGQHLKAQIGVHDDDVTQLDQFSRVPVDMTKTIDLTKEKTEIFSPFGGLLLISIGDTSRLKSIRINVKGAVKAPCFKLGETSEQDWVNTIRKAPAPWAELATDKIVLTVPSYRIRNLTNPVKLMQFWDEVMDADADLAIISRKRVHQERLIVDVDVAYGSLYTEPYKIVAPDDEYSGHMLDEAYMRNKGLWGQFHELGHRHQFFNLDFPGTTEVTVNLYSMYIFDKVLHKGIYQHEGMMNKAEVTQKVKAYFADHPTYEKWSNDPFLALCMYIQIIDAFGWDAIKAANTVYRNLPKDQYPKSDQSKRDLWFTTICKATDRNLTRFFDAWTIPVSDTAKKQVAGYQPWYPKELE